MPTVFISYRRSDTGDVAGRIYERLVPVLGRQQVFADSYSLRPGNWVEQIQKHINEADIFLVMIGPDGHRDERLKQTDDPVRFEIETAIKAGAEIILVTVGEGTRLPQRELLPETLQGLEKRQAYPIRRDPYFPDDVARLIEEMQRVLARRPTRAVRVPPLSCPGLDPGVSEDGTRCGGELNLSAEIRCGRCQTVWGSKRGFPWLVVDDHVRPHDRHGARGASSMAPFWNLCVRFVDVNRQKLLRELALDELRWQAPQRSPRILEVGVSTAANFRMIAEAGMPSSQPISFWGVDLSPAMLRQAAKLKRAITPHQLYLVGADAHRLPFPDEYFDRVISTGCDFGDWSVALRELLRVARRGCIVSVVTLNQEKNGSVWASLASLMNRVLSGRTPSDPAPFVPYECTLLRPPDQINEMFRMFTLRR
jgi:ubiquinone/menaquinone biosynthesis C-methylase UbiE